MRLSNSDIPAGSRHPLKLNNPSALDIETAEKVRNSLLASVETIVKMRSQRNDNFHISFAAALFRTALGDDAFERLVKSEGGDKLSQLIILVRIGGLIAGEAFDQPSDQVSQSFASAIERDLQTLFDTQAKDGPPAWLLPRGKERSNPLEAEHHRRAVVWQRFISTARESTSTGVEEVAERYRVEPRTVRNWMAKFQEDPRMQHRLEQAEGFLKEETSERIAAIFEESFVRIVWMKQRNEHHGRGKPGHYGELLAKQAKEYLAFMGKDNSLNENKMMK